MPKTPSDLATELDSWADARDRINVRREKKAESVGYTEIGDTPPRLLDSKPLRDAAQYLRLMPDSAREHLSAIESWKHHLIHGTAPEGEEPIGILGLSSLATVPQEQDDSAPPTDVRD